MKLTKAKQSDIIVRAIKTKAAVQEAQDKKTDAIVTEMGMVSEPA